MNIPPAQSTAPQIPPNPKESEFNFWTSMGTVLSVAILVATMFNFITPSSFFSTNLQYSLSQALRNQANPQRAATAVPSARIGIVAGHWDNNSGFICADEKTESDVNLTIATYVRQKLMDQGYSVDLLKEFDSQLQNYHGLALIAIHTGSCEYIDNSATGFTVTSSLFSRSQPEQVSKLSACLVNRYGNLTGLRFINNSTETTASYHTYEEINPETPVVAIEAGYLNLDHDFLVNNPAKAAQGITAGILCFLRNENPAESLPTP